MILQHGSGVFVAFTESILQNVRKWFRILEDVTEAFSSFCRCRRISGQTADDAILCPRRKQADFSGGQPQNFRKNMPKFAIFFERNDCKTKRNRIEYMCMRQRGRRAVLYRFTGLSATLIRKEGKRNAENLPAQEDPEKEGARLPQENGYQERPQGTGSQKSKGQSSSDPLIFGNSTLGADTEDPYGMNSEYRF